MATLGVRALVRRARADRMAGAGGRGPEFGSRLARLFERC